MVSAVIPPARHRRVVDVDQPLLPVKRQMKAFDRADRRS